MSCSSGGISSFSTPGVSPCSAVPVDGSMRLDSGAIDEVEVCAQNEGRSLQKVIERQLEQRMARAQVEANSDLPIASQTPLPDDACELLDLLTEVIQAYCLDLPGAAWQRALRRSGDEHELLEEIEPIVEKLDLAMKKFSTFCKSHAKMSGIKLC